MATSVRIVIPTRGPSPSLTALLADLERESAGDPSGAVTVAVVSEGGSAAANRNLGGAQGDEAWLQFLDDDVRLPLGWLPSLLAVLDDPETPDLLGGRVGSLRPRNWFSQAAEDFVVRHKEYPEGWYLVSAHLAVRRAAFVQLGGFDESFGSAGGEDWDLCRRAHAAGLSVGVTDEVRCQHANPTRWGDLSARARAYGAASVTLDRTGRSTQGDSADLADSYDNPTGPPLPIRAVRWLRYEYRSLRRLGRAPLRSARSTLLYVPWMATYLKARRRAAEILEEHSAEAPGDATASEGHAA